MNIFLLPNKVSILVSLAVIENNKLKNCVFVDLNNNITEREVRDLSIIVYKASYIRNNWKWKNLIKGNLLLGWVIIRFMITNFKIPFYKLYLPSSGRYIYWLFAHSWVCKEIYGIEEGLSAYTDGVFHHIYPVKIRFPHKYRGFFCLTDEALLNIAKYDLLGHKVNLNHHITNQCRNFLGAKIIEQNISDSTYIICPSDPFHLGFPVSLRAQIEIYVEVLDKMKIARAYLVPKRTKYSNIQDTLDAAKEVIDALNLSNRLILVHDNISLEIMLFSIKNVTVLSEFSSVLIYAKISGNKGISYLPFFRSFSEIYTRPEELWSKLENKNLLPETIYP